MKRGGGGKGGRFGGGLGGGGRGGRRHRESWVGDDELVDRREGGTLTLRRCRCLTADCALTQHVENRCGSAGTKHRNVLNKLNNPNRLVI